MLPAFSTVFRELGSQNSEAHLRLWEVGASDFNEDIFGVESDLSALRVDDWRQGQDLAGFVVEDWVSVKVLNNRKELFHLDVVAEDVEESIGVH